MMEDLIFLEDDFEFVSEPQELIKDEVLPDKPFWKDAVHRFVKTKVL